MHFTPLLTKGYKVIAGVTAGAMLATTLLLQPLHVQAAHTSNASATLRVKLNTLLSEHVDLSLNVLRNAYDGSEDYEDSLEVLDENTVELAETIGSVYGDNAEASFLTLWRDHIGFFANHTVGLKTNNATMVLEARNNLEMYAQDAGDFFAETIASVEKADVVAGATEHANLLIASMEAYDRGDYMEAYMKQREANMQVSGLANLLATGIVDQFPTNFETEGEVYSTTTASADLRVNLNKLLSEHVALSLNVLRNAYDDSADYEDSLNVLDKNTVDLAETIGSVYGNNAETTFLNLWRDHIGFFADHTIGLKSNDANMVLEAREDLDMYAQDIADFFSGAIPSVERSDVIAGATEHANLLVASMEAYDRGDYMEAYMKQREAYAQIGGLALLLSTGITNQFPEQFDLETSSSSMSMSSSSRMMNFPDVNTNDDAEAILYLKERNIVEGNPDGTFRPDRTLNRAEFVKIALLAQDAAISMETTCFPDLLPNEWYSRYVCTAENLGIVRGYPDGRFSPNKAIQVEEAYKVAAETFYGNEVQTSFPWYNTYVEVAVRNNFDIAVPVGDTITRSQMATIIANAMQNR